MCVELSDTNTICVELSDIDAICVELSDTDSVRVWNCRTLTLYVCGVVRH